jgi:tRNA-splicing ligase RtcB
MADLKIFAKTIEPEAIAQVELLLAQEAFKDCKIRIMPDTHVGKGCVIGFTADLGDKVIPNIVGVDIGCGMLTVGLGKQQIDFEKLDKLIRKFVPSGRHIHNKKLASFPKILDLNCYSVLKRKERFERSIGTLGGGNHFIEIDRDDSGNMYLIIHTGSRNLGKQVADYYQNLAIKILKDKDTSIPRDLCYLTGKYRDMYLHDMRICQEFADFNRHIIADIIIDKMGWSTYDSFQTIHNYIDLDSNIVRKGAIRALKGERLLVPINMRDGCILGIGKGNEDWNYSAPHGAGRLMSRNEARKQLDLAEYKNTMAGIYTTSISKDTIDEAPMAYKTLDEIVECIADTVDIEANLKPVYNFKASE